MSTTTRLRLSVMCAWLAATPCVALAQHTGHPQPSPVQQPAQKPADDHAAHRHAPEPSSETPREPIPAITDEDRAAAFPPDVHGHTVHDRRVTTFVLFDELEWLGEGSGAGLENTTWIGGDMNRFWVRAEAEMEDGRVEDASVDALWGHSFSHWWDVVVGLRQDIRPGEPQTWAALGVQGLAPHWFEIEATAYVGADARTLARFEAEYDLLLTNRLILQPVIELEAYGKRDPERGIEAGLSSIEAGLRLRYEIRREFAPYVGVVWDRKLFGTADLAREEGEGAGGVKLALGVRTWF